jgi:mRNA-degrading endonuclease HigB of HigAB toxin-antitoxin module
MSKYIKLERGKSLLAAGYSLLVASEDKLPCHQWKALMTTPWTVAELEKNIQNPKAFRYGYPTGYNDILVIDIDLKVLPMELRASFFDEFIAFVRDNVDGFDKKVAVHKTMNFGYHLTYRTRSMIGNEKIAVPVLTGLKSESSGKTQALIESRGTGGYALLYDECANGLDYTAIQYLSDEEHNTILAICRMYDERVEVQEIEQPKKEKATGVSSWQDYNQRHTVFDVVGDEFKVIRNLASKTVIKRHGATSAHSGYVFKDSGCLYLFSTGTAYPNEKLLSPFALFAYKYHSGNMSTAAKELYASGYGDRVKLPQPEIATIDKPKVEKLAFPLDIYPEDIQRYILECNRTLDSSVDYMGAGLLWMLSLMVGNSMKIQVKSGWDECCTIWVTMVGKAGVGKSPSINNIIRPLVQQNSREIREYQKRFREWDEYDKLGKKEKEQRPEVPCPIKKQFIVNDVTLEALVELHEENPNAVGVFKDELAGWIKDMNKYRAGSDLEFWLSTFSNQPAALNRKTVKNTYVHSPIIPVLGGIQPAVLNQVFTDEYRDNGFSDRMLLCFPDIQVEEYNDNELSGELIEWYYNYIGELQAFIKNDLIIFDAEREIEPHIIPMDVAAKKEWKRIYNKITSMQNSDDESEFTKSMLPKQKTYVPRFALLLSIIDAYANGEDLKRVIDKETMLKAERLSDYFVTMSKKVKVDSMAYNVLRESSIVKGTATPKERCKQMWTTDTAMNRTSAAELLCVSRRTVINWIKEFENEP